MTEAVGEVQDGAGSTKVRVAIISAAVPVLLAVIGLTPRLIGGEGSPPESPVVTTVEAATSPAEAPSPKLWRIEGKVEPEDASVAIRLVRVEGLAETPPDSHGQFEFANLPEGVYRLFVVPLDGNHDITVSLRTHNPEPVIGPSPIRVVTIAEQ
jgi:hypothetical protein